METLLNKYISSCLESPLKLHINKPVQYDSVQELVTTNVVEQSSSNQNKKENITNNYKVINKRLRTSDDVYHEKRKQSIKITKPIANAKYNMINSCCSVPKNEISYSQSLLNSFTNKKYSIEGFQSKQMNVSKDIQRNLSHNTSHFILHAESLHHLNHTTPKRENSLHSKTVDIQSNINNFVENEVPINDDHQLLGNYSGFMDSQQHQRNPSIQRRGIESESEKLCRTRGVGSRYKMVFPALLLPENPNEQKQSLSLGKHVPYLHKQMRITRKDRVKEKEDSSKKEEQEENTVNKNSLLKFLLTSSKKREHEYQPLKISRAFREQCLKSSVNSKVSSPQKNKQNQKYYTKIYTQQSTDITASSQFINQGDIANTEFRFSTQHFKRKYPNPKQILFKC